MNIEPQGTKLLVKPLPRKEVKMDSGIIMPENAMAELSEGEVVAVAAGLPLVVGDIVLFPAKKGVGHIENNEFYLWLDADARREEVWGVIPKSKT